MNSPALVPIAKAAPHLDLVSLTMQACSVAKNAASSALDGLINGSPASLSAVRECEETLDEFDRELDERLPQVITQVSPAEARELLVCLKLMLDLERVGDLIASFAERSAIVRNRLDMEDVEHLTRMSCLLENMLSHIAPAFRDRDVEQAIRILRSDPQIDRLRNLLVGRHTEGSDGFRVQESLHVLAMANALERAGDHVKNMAEELCHLATGHTVRHLLRSKDKPVEQLYIEWLGRQSADPK